MRKTVRYKKTVLNVLLWITSSLVFCTAISGCGLEGYSNDWIYPKGVTTVYVEMFDTGDFRRGYEYILTDAICKRIEAQTPYKIVSDMDRADTVLSGQLAAVSASVLATDRYTSAPIENEANVIVTVSWKNLRTGELLINNEKTYAFASYSTLLGQDFDYGAKVAVNRAAQKVVELMEESW